MRYWELFAPWPLVEAVRAELGSNREPRLTLKAIHKLKLTRAMQKRDELIKLDIIAQMYGPGTGDEEAEVPAPIRKAAMRGLKAEQRRKKDVSAAAIRSVEGEQSRAEEVQHHAFVSAVRGATD